MQVGSLGQEDALEEGMETHSNIAWRIPWMEEPGGLQSMGPQRVGHDKVSQQACTEAKPPERPTQRTDGPKGEKEVQKGIGQKETGKDKSDGMLMLCQNSSQ